MILLILRLLIKTIKLANKSEFISIREGLFYEDSLYCFDDEIKDIIHKVEKKVATTIKLTSI